MKQHTDDDLDIFFRAARKAEAQPDDDLVARVLADAVPPTRTSAQHVPQPGMWARLSAAIGGWPAMSGLVAAGLGGLWIGVAPPAGVEDWAAQLVGTTESVPLSLEFADLGLEAQDG